MKKSFIPLIVIFVVFVLAAIFYFKADSSTVSNVNIVDQDITSIQTNNSPDFKRQDSHTIHICHSETPPKSLDPALFVSKQITYLIYDRLITSDNDGQIINSLASSIDQINNNTIKIKLKNNVYFHNFTPLTSRDVRFSIDRIISNDSTSPLKTLFKSIKSVNIIDDYTLTINTYYPDYALIRKLAYVQIIPEDYFKEVGEEYFSKHPVGSGLYKFDKWKKNGDIVLKRNELYWDKLKPDIEKVVFTFIQTDKSSRKEQIDSLMSGKIDLLLELPGIHSLKLQRNPNTKLIKVYNQPVVHRMKLNSQKEPLSDIRLRKAINYAINRGLLIKILEKGNGIKIATNSVKSEFGHNPNLKPYPYDLKTARQLVKESGFKDLKIKIASTEEVEILAKAISKDLTRIGISSTVTVMSNEEMTDEFLSIKQNNNQVWDYDMAIYSSKNPLMHVGVLYEEGLCSYGAWSITKDDRVDKLCKKLKSTLDKDKQLQICYKLEELAYNNFWFTPIYQLVGTYGAAIDLNIKISASSYIDFQHTFFETKDN